LNAERNLLQRFFHLGVTHRAASILFLLAGSLIALGGVTRLTVDTGFSRLIPDDDADKQAYLRVTREFGSDNRTFIYVRDAELWTPAKLAALDRLQRSLRDLPFVERVDDLSSHPGVRSIDGRVQARPLLADQPADPDAAERVRREALQDPIAARNLISGDGQALAIAVTVRERIGAITDRAAFDAFERVLAPARQAFGEVFQVGPPRINAELRAGLDHDLRVLVPASALLLAATVFLFYRSVFAALTPLLTAGLSLLWAFGIMGWSGIPVNILCAMLPSLVVVIGATENMRMISGYYRGLAQGDRPDRNAATQRMLQHLGVPTVLTVLVTGIGFASNAIAGIALIRDFAIASAVAILANGVITVLLLPLLYAAMGPQQGRQRGVAVTGRLAMLVVATFGRLRKGMAIWVLAATAGLCALFIHEALNLFVTNEPLTFFRAGRPLVQDAQRLQSEMAGMKLFYITLESNTDRAFQEPANLQKLADIQAFMTKQAIFDRSLSLADLLSLANRETAGGNPEAYRVPASRKLVAQFLLLFQQRDLEPYVSHDFRRANIVVRHNVRDSSTLNHNIRELRQVVRNYAGPDMITSVVGENLMVNAAADRLLQGQAIALLGLLSMIFITMSLMFTSVKGGFIALVPSVVPILLLLGVMRVNDIPLSVGTVMVAVIAIGIAIEGTVHLFSRYSELCRRTSNYDEAVLETVREEAAPVVATSLALALGFGVLLLSDFTVVAQFGALAAAAMLFSIFANLLITPMVMARIRLVGLYEILAMSVQREALEKSPLFQGMSDYQIRKAILISELHEVAGGVRLVEQGAMDRSMYLVLNGELAVIRRDGGAERQLATLRAGDVFGEIGFIRATRRTADVRALGPVSVLRFDHGKLEKDLAFFPHIMAKLNYNISGILGQRLAEMVEARQAEQRQPPAPAPKS
jgi:predicted RND superfamily exporter protein